MRYVFLSYNYSPNFITPESWLKRTACYTGILEELVAGGNTVINIKQIGYQGQYLHKGVHHHFISLNTTNTKLPLKFNRYIKSLKPDVVVYPGLHQPLQLMCLALILGPKVKLMVHNHAEKPFNGLKKYAQRMADRFAHAYLFASRPMGLEWVKRGNLQSAGKIHEVMEVSSVFKPIDKASACSKTGATGKPVFLWVGRLNDNKDPLTVVRAFIKFAGACPAARLYMIYHTDELLPEIKQLLKASGNKAPITLVGRLAHDDLLNWFNSADFIVSGSYYEGSGTAVCEAMSCGCIPVVTDIQSFRMITDNGRCGLLYKPGNEQELLAVLQQALKTDTAKLKEQVLAHYHSTLSFKAIAGRFDQIAAGLPI